MPKVSYTETKGLFQESGTGIVLNGELTTPKLHGGVQREAADAAITVGANTTLLILAADCAGGNKVVTMPAAKAGRFFKVIWEVEQASNNRVFTRVGSDQIGGNITTRVQGDAVGDGDSVAFALATATITVQDDVNIGSWLEFYCAVDGQWLVIGDLIVDVVGSVPS